MRGVPGDSRHVVEEDVHWVASLFVRPQHPSTSGLCSLTQDRGRNNVEGRDKDNKAIGSLSSPPKNLYCTHLTFDTVNVSIISLYSDVVVCAVQGKGPSPSTSCSSPFIVIAASKVDNDVSYIDLDIDDVM